MSWDAIFGAANMLALLAWASLILLPRWPALLSAILYLVVGLLSMLYAGILIGLVGGFVDPAAIWLAAISARSRVCKRCFQPRAG